MGHSRQASKRDRARMRRQRRQARYRKARDREMLRELGLSAHRQCGRKRRYDTREAAEVAVAKRVNLGSGYLRVYRCGICGGWHMTHLRRSGDADEDS